MMKMKEIRRNSSSFLASQVLTVGTFVSLIPTTGPEQVQAIVTKGKERKRKEKKGREGKRRGEEGREGNLRRKRNRKGCLERRKL